MEFYYSVPSSVPVLRQPFTMAAWATVATSLISWYDNKKYSIEDVLDIAGQKYQDIYINNTGLYRKEDQFLEFGDVGVFLNKLGIKYVSTNSHDFDWFNQLQNFGPVWLTAYPSLNSPWSEHAFIVIGIYKEGGKNAGGYNVLICIDPKDGLIKFLSEPETWNAGYREGFYLSQV